MFIWTILWGSCLVFYFLKFKFVNLIFLVFFNYGFHICQTNTWIPSQILKRKTSNLCIYIISNAILLFLGKWRSFLTYKSLNNVILV